MTSSSIDLPEILNLDDSLLPAKWMQDCILTGSKSDLGSIAVVRSDSPHGKDAIRLGSRLNFHHENDIRIDIPSAIPVEEGDVIRLRFWFRCTQSLCGDGFVVARISSESDPEQAFCEINVSANLDWTECTLACQVPNNLDAGQLLISFQCGFEMQTIEIVGVHAENLRTTRDLSTINTTKVSYPGRETSASWREIAMKRIDEIRKSDLVVHVTDQNGKPLRGASVQFRQTEQSFGFGTCVDASLLLGESRNSEIYREKVRSMFNCAVFENDMKWQAVGEGMSEIVLRSIDWLHENGLSVRGHNMLWPSWRWSPEHLQSLASDPIALGRRVMSHIHEIGSYYKGKVTDWDVVNEPYTNHDLMDNLGGFDVIVDWYKAAQLADPTCKLCLNDFGIFEGGRQNQHRDHFFQTITDLLAKGAPIDTIGIQTHFGTNLPSPMRILEVLDLFGSFGLPIESTEISLNLTDRALQADYLSDYMLAIYSHPKIKSALLWGIWTNRHWRPDGALFEDDWTPRPIAKAWTDTRERFKTSSTCNTDSTGTAAVRGFHGTYEIEAEYQGQTVRSNISLGETGSTVKLSMQI